MLDESGLARAVSAHESNRLPGSDVESHSFQDFLLAYPVREVTDSKERLGALVLSPSLGITGHEAFTTKGSRRLLGMAISAGSSSPLVLVLVRPRPEVPSGSEGDDKES